MPVEPWDLDGAGVVELPSGRRVRGRGLRSAVPPAPLPTLAVHFSAGCPPQPPWERYWVRCRDFWVPSAFAAAHQIMRLAHSRAAVERVEIGCPHGVGRTGMGLAALAVLDGLDPDSAVDWVRRRYHPRAVEVPWQRRYLRAVVAERTTR